MAPANKTNKVQAAKKAAAKVTSTEAVQKRKVRTNVHFFRPKTLQTARKPKAPKKSVVRQNKLDKYRILKNPVTTESAMKKIEEINTLVFNCAIKASKAQIKDAVQSLYEVKCARVNSLILPDGSK